MSHVCTPCGYTTSRKIDLDRHNQSKKHLQIMSNQPNHTQDIPISYQNEKKVFICLYCKSEYSNSSALARHKKACGDKNTKETEVKSLQEKVSDLQKQVSKYEKQVETYEMMLKSLTSPQSVNYFNYICTTYPNPPALTGQKSYVNLLEAKTMTLIEVITMYYGNDQLVNFIGDYIIKLYKKGEAKDQSMWSTDISRLTYIISESCKEKGNIWAYDKKGSKLKKIIIEPALQYIKEELLKFCKENSTATDDPEFSQLQAAINIIPLINNGSLASDINKYIAPEFAVNQNDNQAMVKV